MKIIDKLKNRFNSNKKCPFCHLKLEEVPIYVGTLKHGHLKCEKCHKEWEE